MQTHHTENPLRPNLMRALALAELTGMVPSKREAISWHSNPPINADTSHWYQIWWELTGRFSPGSHLSLDTPTPQYHLLPIDRIFILHHIGINPPSPSFHWSHRFHLLSSLTAKGVQEQYHMSGVKIFVQPYQIPKWDFFITNRKAGFWKKKWLNFVILLLKVLLLLLLSWLKHFWGISIDRQRCKIWTGGQAESWRKMNISDCEEDMAWFLDTNYLDLSVSFTLSLPLRLPLSL